MRIILNYDHRARRKIFDRLTGGFRQAFSLSPEDFTPEELGQILTLDTKRTELSRQIAQVYSLDLTIRKDVLIRKGLAATSLDLLKTEKGNGFNAKSILRKPYVHARKDGETAYFCDTCQIWTRGKPQRKIYVSEGVVAYECLVGEHPMGSGLFPLEI